MAQEQKKKTIKKEKIIDFPKEMFESIENKPLLAQAVRVYLANQRQGNASTKTRGEVHGTTKKVYKQKGTGRARHGAKKAPIFVGGGIAGGPKPRDYSLKLNKQQKKIALICALTLKRNEKKLFVLENGTKDTRFYINNARKRD
jgi:large subunit ribosomal protein L4